MIAAVHVVSAQKLHYSYMLLAISKYLGIALLITTSPSLITLHVFLAKLTLCLLFCKEIFNTVRSQKTLTACYKYMQCDFTSIYVDIYMYNKTKSPYIRFTVHA